MTALFTGPDRRAQDRRALQAASNRADDAKWTERRQADRRAAQALQSAEPGHCEGETCGRDGCQGDIGTRSTDDCSCHLSAPCRHCTAPRNFCPDCGWEEADEPREQPVQTGVKAARDWGRPRTLTDLDPTKVDWISSPDSSCSMVKEGVYPVGMSEAEVRKHVDGTFGGRFESFGGGRFRFLAYTD